MADALRYETPEQQALCHETFSLRSQGYLVREIAAEMSCSEATVHNRLNWYRANAPQDDNTPEARRLLGVAQLDNLIAKLRERVAEGDERAIEITSRMIDQYTTLVGAKAPVTTKIEQKTITYDVPGVDTSRLK